MIAIFFSRPLTLTISCFAITSLFQELRHKATPASRRARRKLSAKINVGICGMAPGWAHNSLSNTKLVVAGLSNFREQAHCARNLRAGKLIGSIVARATKRKNIRSYCCLGPLYLGNDSTIKSKPNHRLQL